MVHPPKRGLVLMGTCPMVHTGFYQAWTANGLNMKVLDCLQVWGAACLHDLHACLAPWAAEAWPCMYSMVHVCCHAQGQNLTESLDLVSAVMSSLLSSIRAGQVTPTKPVDCTSIVSACRSCSAVGRCARRRLCA